MSVEDKGYAIAFKDDDGATLEFEKHDVLDDNTMLVWASCKDVELDAVLMTREQYEAFKVWADEWFAEDIDDF